MSNTGAIDLQPETETLAPDDRPMPERSFPALAVMAGVVALCLLSLAGVFVAQGDDYPFLKKWILLSPLAAGLFMAASCFLRAGSLSDALDRKAPLAWRCAGLGAALFCLGRLYHVYALLFMRGSTAPWPSPADAGYLGQFLFYLAACLLFYGGYGSQSRLRRAGASLLAATFAPRERLASTEEAKRGVDTLLAVLSLTALCGFFLLQPLASAGSGSARAAALAYPLMSLAVLSAVVFVAFHRRGNDAASRWLRVMLAGMAMLAVAGAWHAYAGVVSHLSPGASSAPYYRPQSWLALLWTVGFGLVGLSAWDARWGRRTAALDRTLEQGWQVKARLILPYLLSLGACLLAVTRDLADGSLGVWSLLFTAAIFSLIVRRQTLMSYESLDFAGELQRRVEEATEEIRRKNDALEVQKGRLQDQTLTLQTSKEELERSGRRITAIHSVTVAANESLEARTILRRTLHELTRVVPDSWGGAYVQKDGGADLAVSLFDHVSPRLRPPDRLPLLPGGLACLLPKGEHASILVPLVSRDEPLAMLVIGILGREPTDEEMTLLSLLGRQIGAALENARLYQEAKDAADRDPLTGLLNHRALQERLEQEIARARREDKLLSLLVMDLNSFKLFNDTYGHPVGDKALKTVASAMKEACRATDVYGRHGGDEFMMILPDCDADEAVTVADRVNEYLGSHGYREPGEDRVIPISVSAGVAVYPKDGRLRDHLLEVADENMYDSKRRGGRQAVAATEEARNLRQLREGEGFATLEAMVHAVDNKDNYTRRHSNEVTRYSVWMAEHLGWSGEEIQTVRMAGLLHDVGKICVPDSVLRKPSRLTDEEEAKMRMHPEMGALLVSAVPELSSALPGVRYHHEKWDGTGYPERLAGEAIPVLGRLMAVPDAFSAMTSDRPYRKALPLEVAFDQLEKGKGTQFDPAMVDAFFAACEPRIQAGEIVIDSLKEANRTA